jgi:hypothetical protein
VAAGSVAAGSVAGGCVAAGGSVCAGVAAPPHADSKSPSTLMNENNVTNLFIALLSFLDLILQVV